MGLEERKQEVLNSLEARALESEKDYQREYDVLKKLWEKQDNDRLAAMKNRDKLEDEIALAQKRFREAQEVVRKISQEQIKTEVKMDKLADESKQKGFKIKRSETVNAELRALNTEKDYQKELDKLAKLRDKEYELADKCLDDMNEFGAKMQKERAEHLRKAKQYNLDAFDIYQQAKNRGFNIKERSADADTETRALNTEKDYQKAYDDLAKEVFDMQREANNIRDVKQEEYFKKLMKQYEWDAKQEANQWMVKEYDKMQAKMKPLVKEMSDLVAKAKDKGFTIKKAWFDRSKDINTETRALDTEDDYQDEIDDLKKQIDRLYDEGTDLGFKLKRSEDMEQELRALKTEQDYQREYDNVYEGAEILKKALSRTKLKFMTAKEELEDCEAGLEHYSSLLKSIVKEANKKGFKIKEKKLRSEEASFETRKQEILDNLELRALDTQKDYEKVVASLEKKIKELEDEYNRYYSKSAIEKHIKVELESVESKIRSKYEREALAVQNQIVYNQRLLKNTHDEAKKKGFKVKRSLEFNFEARALETEKDYQRELDKILKEMGYIAEHIDDHEETIKKYRKDWEAKMKEATSILDEGRKKGFKLKFKM